MFDKIKSINLSKENKKNKEDKEVEKKEVKFEKIDYPFKYAPRGDTVFKYPRKDGSTVSAEDPFHFLEDSNLEATEWWIYE